jgi:hypothetical protein
MLPSSQLAVFGEKQMETGVLLEERKRIIPLRFFRVSGPKKNPGPLHYHKDQSNSILRVTAFSAHKNNPNNSEKLRPAELRAKGLFQEANNTIPLRSHRPD